MDTDPFLFPPGAPDAPREQWGAAPPASGPSPTPPPSPAQRGWHPDPWFTGQYRWADGERWTAHVFPVGSVSPRAGAGSLPPMWPGAAPPPAPQWYGIGPATDAMPEAGLPPAVAAPPGRRGLRSLVVGVLVVALGFVVGGGIEYWRRSGDTRDRGIASAAPPSAAPAPSGTAAAVPAVLRRLVVQQADLPTDQQVTLLPGGTDARAQPTLDLCNGTFASEAQRTARLQVQAATATGVVTLSTEAVLYRSPSDTSSAFTELRKVASSCPSTPVTSPVGEPTVTTTFGPRPDTSWPAVTGVDRQAYAITTTDTRGNQDRSLVVYLRRGRALLGVYLPQGNGSGAGQGASSVSVDGKSAPADVVAIFEHRLASVSSADVGA